MDLVESDKQQGLVVPVWKTYEVLLRQSCPEVQLPNEPNKECCRRFRLSVLIQYVFFSFCIGLPGTRGKVCLLRQSQESFCCRGNRVCITFFLSQSKMLLVTFHVHKCNDSVSNNWRDFFFFFLNAFNFPLLCPQRETSLYGNLILKKGVIPAELLLWQKDSAALLRDEFQSSVIIVDSVSGTLCMKSASFVHLNRWTWNSFVLE